MKPKQNIFKIQNFIIYSIYLFVSIFFTSCETQEDVIKSADRQIKTEIVNLNTLKNKPLELLDFQRKINKRSKLSASNRTVYDSINNFEIDEEFVKKIQAGNYESYTFPMTKEGDAKIFNLLLSEKSEGGYSMFLVKYDFTPEEFKLYGQSQLDPKQPIYIPVEFDENGLMTYRYANPQEAVICTTIWIEIETTVLQGTGDLGLAPTTYTAGHEWINLGTTCTGGGDGNGGDGTDYQPIPGTPENPNTNPNPGGSGGNGTNSGNQNNTGGVYGNGGTDGTGYVYTAPVLYVNRKAIKDRFIATLNPEQNAWLDTHPNQEDILLNYLYNEEPEFEESLTAEDIAINNIEDIMTGEQPDNIEPLIKNPCQSTIITNVYSQCSDLSTAIVDLYAGDRTYNLRYKTVSSLPNNANALTTYDGDFTDINDAFVYNFSVLFRKSYINNATDVSIARTTIHENIHALLLYLSKSHSITPISINPTYNQLLDAYMDAKSVPNNDTGHHNFMLGFVNDIAAQLKSYGISKGYSLSDQFYNSMAWAGLTNTPTFQHYFPPTLTDGSPNPLYNNIMGTIEAENTNHNPTNPADGSPILDLGGNQIHPKGQPCN